jgi:hypothetical protein
MSLPGNFFLIIYSKTVKTVALVFGAVGNHRRPRTRQAAPEYDAMPKQSPC